MTTLSLIFFVVCSLQAFKGIGAKKFLSKFGIPIFFVVRNLKCNPFIENIKGVHTKKHNYISLDNYGFKRENNIEII